MRCAAHAVNVRIGPAIRARDSLKQRTKEMRTWSKKLAATAAVIGALRVASHSPALADVKDYEFQLVQSEIKKGDGAIVAVRLVNKKSGKAVPDAVIFAKRIDMAPEGMATMQETLAPLPATEPGTYRFKTNLSMAGRWQLSLGAKVQGEEGTVETKLVLRAVP
jgi:YtkA-like